MIKKGRQERELDFERIILKVLDIYQVWPNRKHWFLFFHGVISVFDHSQNSVGDWGRI